MPEEKKDYVFMGHEEGEYPCAQNSDLQHGAVVSLTEEECANARSIGTILEPVGEYPIGIDDTPVPPADDASQAEPPVEQ